MENEYSLQHIIRLLRLVRLLYVGMGLIALVEAVEELVHIMEVLPSGYNNLSLNIMKKWLFIPFLHNCISEFQFPVLASIDFCFLSIHI